MMFEFIRMHVDRYNETVDCLNKGIPLSEHFGPIPEQRVKLRDDDSLPKIALTALFFGLF